jgi:DNA-binding CsgD family transcriptional regulator
MDKRIIILHRSEIIRKGLISIIRSTFQDDIIEISSPAELQDFMNMHNRLILILVEAEAPVPEFMKYVEILKKKNRVRISGITGNGTLSQGSLPFQDRIDTAMPARELLARIGSLLDDGSGVPSAGHSPNLTGREVEVLRLVALGYLNKEIADKLSISFHTVISHRKNITMKLGIKSISGLTVYAVINRLIDIDQFDPEKIV